MQKVDALDGRIGDFVDDVISGVCSMPVPSSICVAGNGGV